MHRNSAEDSYFHRHEQQHQRQQQQQHHHNQCQQQHKQHQRQQQQQQHRGSETSQKLHSKVIKLACIIGLSCPPFSHTSPPNPAGPPRPPSTDCGPPPRLRKSRIEYGIIWRNNPAVILAFVRYYCESLLLLLPGLL